MPRPQKSEASDASVPAYRHLWARKNSAMCSCQHRHDPRLTTLTSSQVRPQSSQPSRLTKADSSQRVLWTLSKKPGRSLRAASTAACEVTATTLALGPLTQSSTPAKSLQHKQVSPLLLDKHCDLGMLHQLLCSLSKQVLMLQIDRSAHPPQSMMGIKHRFKEL